MNANHPPRILIAFDFGMKRIGVAIGQTITKTARPLDTLTAKQGEPNWQTITQLIKKWLPDALVVGIPLNMDGTDQPVSTLARQFANALRERYQLPVHEIDERLTTKDARERLFKQGGYKALQDGQVDSIAAQLILQNWFAEKSGEDKL
jgi:putative Holliday junction resolvase